MTVGTFSSSTSCYKECIRKASINLLEGGEKIIKQTCSSTTHTDEFGVISHYKIQALSNECKKEFKRELISSNLTYFSNKSEHKI